MSKLDELKKLCDEATEGPWEIYNKVGLIGSRPPNGEKETLPWKVVTETYKDVFHIEY